MMDKLERKAKEMFQSTHPRGVRLAGLSVNSSARKVSIHAPARGATMYPTILLELD